MAPNTIGSRPPKARESIDSPSSTPWHLPIRTLHRLERTPSKGPQGRYRKIVEDPATMDALLIDVFGKAHAEPPEELILDVDHGRGMGLGAPRPSERVFRNSYLTSRTVVYSTCHERAAHQLKLERRGS